MDGVRAVATVFLWIGAALLGAGVLVSLFLLSILTHRDPLATLILLVPAILGGVFALVPFAAWAVLRVLLQIEENSRRVPAAPAERAPAGPRLERFPFQNP